VPIGKEKGHRASKLRDDSQEASSFFRASAMSVCETIA
jgi:hypothetical protein